MSNWTEMLEQLPEGAELINCTLTPEEMQVEFDSGYGLAKGQPFLAWSRNFVFFPSEYDGSEWVSAAPRNPGDTVTKLSHY